MPYRFEAGTPNVSGALGLAAAIDYLENLGYDRIAEHHTVLTEALETALRSVKGARTLMAVASPRLPIGSLVPESGRINPDYLATALSNSHNIMVRSGYHCAHPLMDSLSLSMGTLRASAYIYNTLEEINIFGNALKSLFRRLMV